MKCNTLSEGLLGNSRCANLGVTFIKSEKSEIFVSFKELYNKALECLLFLQKNGLKKGDELIFQIEDNEYFIYIFWGCILGGIVPVPATVGNNNEHKYKVIKIWDILKNPKLIIDRKSHQKLMEFTQKGEALNNIISNDSEILIESMRKNSIFVEDLVFTGEKAEPTEICLEDIAFIQFSSGSTGDPKGVILTHGNLVTNIYDIINSCKMNSKDNILSWMPLTHDMGLIGCHITPVILGINSYSMPTTLFIKRPGLWMKKASLHKSTILSSPNFGYIYYLEHFNEEAKQSLDLSCVRLMFNGAEPISAEVCDEFLNTLKTYGLKENTMYPVYGMAEASLAITFPPLDEAFKRIYVKRDSMSLGRKIEILEGGFSGNELCFVDEGYPLDNCLLRICDEENNQVSENFVGYIHIKGKNVTSGYYNNIEATSNAFTSDGWLQTGDLGFLSNKRLYVTGRVKDIFFVNGQNYYLHDIERLVEQVEGFKSGRVAAVSVFNHKLQKEEIIVFTIYRKQIKEFIPQAIEAIKYVNNQIGIQIRIILPVKNIPKTTSGKLQRFKLKEEYENGEYQQTEDEIEHCLHIGFVSKDEPRDDIEKKLIGIWQEVLNVEQLGTDLSFFEAGGNSLKATMLGAKIYQEFDIEIPLSSVFETPTVKALADYIRSMSKVISDHIQPVQEREYYPVSSAQRRMYIMYQMNPNSIGYNTPIAFVFECQLDKNRFESAIRTVISRHEILRTSFEIENGEPVQKIYNKVDFSLDYEDMNENQVNSFIKGFVRPFNLNKAPILRLALLNIGGLRNVFVIDTHHIIMDGWTLSIFMKEVVRIYLGETLEEVYIQYKDYAVWHQNLLKKDNISKQKEYWLSEFVGNIPILNLMYDFQRPDIKDFSGDIIHSKLNSKLTSELNILALENGATLFMVLLSIFNILLYKYSGQEDIVIGSPVAGRQNIELENTMGMFVNMLSIRSFPKPNITFANFLSEVKEKCVKAYENQDYQFEQLVMELNLERNLGRNPLFDVTFALQNIDLTLTDSAIKFDLYRFDYNISRFDMFFWAIENGDEINLNLEYSTSLFKKDTAQRMLKHYEEILKQVLENQNIRLEHLYLSHDLAEASSLEIEEKEFDFTF